MKYSLSLTIILSILWSSCSNVANTADAQLSTKMDSVSYAYGVSMITQMRTQVSDKINTDLCIAGIEQVVSKQETRFDPQEANMIFRNFMAFGRGMSYETSTDATPSNLSNMLDSASYSLGVLLGTSLSQGEMEGINTDLIRQAITDMDSETGALMTIGASDSVLMKYTFEIRQKQATENLALGEAFLAENATKEGVIVTESGLQYEVIKQGTGDFPVDGNSVTFLYTGYFLNGEIFDRSQPDVPVTYNINQLIPGWTEALKLMNPGSVYKLYVPSDIGYGAQGSGPDIPPNSTLIFEVELVEFN